MVTVRSVSTMKARFVLTILWSSLAKSVTEKLEAVVGLWHYFSQKQRQYSHSQSFASHAYYMPTPGVLTYHLSPVTFATNESNFCGSSLK